MATKYLRQFLQNFQAQAQPAPVAPATSTASQETPVAATTAVLQAPAPTTKQPTVTTVTSTQIVQPKNVACTTQQPSKRQKKACAQATNKWKRAKLNCEPPPSKLVQLTTTDPGTMGHSNYNRRMIDISWKCHQAVTKVFLAWSQNTALSFLPDKNVLELMVYFYSWCQVYDYEDTATSKHFIVTGLQTQLEWAGKPTTEQNCFVCVTGTCQDAEKRAYIELSLQESLTLMEQFLEFVQNLRRCQNKEIFYRFAQQFCLNLRPQFQSYSKQNSEWYTVLHSDVPQSIKVKSAYQLDKTEYYEYAWQGSNVQITTLLGSPTVSKIFKTETSGFADFFEGYKNIERNFNEDDYQRQMDAPFEDLDLDFAADFEVLIRKARDMFAAPPGAYSYKQEEHPGAHASQFDHDHNLWKFGDGAKPDFELYGFIEEATKLEDDKFEPSTFSDLSEVSAISADVTGSEQFWLHQNVKWVMQNDGVWWQGKPVEDLPLRLLYFPDEEDDTSSELLQCEIKKQTLLTDSHMINSTILKYTFAVSEDVELMPALLTVMFGEDTSDTIFDFFATQKLRQTKNPVSPTRYSLSPRQQRGADGGGGGGDRGGGGGGSMPHKRCSDLENAFVRLSGLKTTDWKSAEINGVDLDDLYEAYKRNYPEHFATSHVDDLLDLHANDTLLSIRRRLVRKVITCIQELREIQGPQRWARLVETAANLQAGVDSLQEYKSTKNQKLEPGNVLTLAQLLTEKKYDQPHDSLTKGRLSLEEIQREAHDQVGKIKRKVKDNIHKVFFAAGRVTRQTASQNAFKFFTFWVYYWVQTQLLQNVVQIFCELVEYRQRWGGMITASHECKKLMNFLGNYKCVPDSIRLITNGINLANSQSFFVSNIAFLTYSAQNAVQRAIDYLNDGFGLRLTVDKVWRKGWMHITDDVTSSKARLFARMVGLMLYEMMAQQPNSTAGLGYAGGMAVIASYGPRMVEVHRVAKALLNNKASTAERRSLMSRYAGNRRVGLVEMLGYE